MGLDEYLERRRGLKMGKEENDYSKPVVIFALILLVTLVAVGIAVSNINFGDYDTEEVRSKMEDHLYEKYGKEFVVDRIGVRSSRGDDFFQARIYPKEIVGTNKEGDDYYYASASADKKSFGRIGGVGDSYELLNLKLDIEDYLLPRTKEIFGDRVRMKVEAHYKRREPGNEHFWGYKVESFEKARRLIAEDPENRMIELDLDVYIFDRIADDEEKEERREDIFEFVQYLQEEGLFEYLEMRVFSVDERVLAPSYDEFESEIRSSNKVTKEVENQEGRTVELPPMDLRERMSRELQAELDEMSQEELLANMQEIRKDELTYEGIRKNNTQYRTLVYSKGMMKERYTSSYRSGSDNVKDYDDISDVILDKSLVYTYVN